ncbi:MAG: sigma-70 family RNA polymerase sigma factor [Chitinophagaceae bacterium]|nr:MAG: sigma-70 family RNA polymerase sigma factor [Chitinophagaceae bacterium]
MTGNEMIPHLFRTEYSKLVSVLAKTFGLEHIEIAEDIASDTFLQAIDTWPYKGLPVNPTAWLYTVAKNKTLNHLARNNNFRKIVSGKQLADKHLEETDIDFSDANIADSQLRMLFTICHPSISKETQICLALKILCGFSLAEIADAFLSNRETIHKRLQRGKKTLQQQLQIQLPDEKSLKMRLQTVLKTIYLLFSEGYYSESNASIIRTDFCVDALNLTYLLLGNSLTNTHSTNSLMSLMCFQSSRLAARKSVEGELILYDDQDRNLWDKEFIEKGFYYLQQASKWEITSTYYIEASIAYWHTVDNSNPDKWISILKLYDALLHVNPSPVAALNRIWASSKVYGDKRAISELEKLSLTNNHFYFLLLAELYKQTDTRKAVDCLRNALSLCKTGTEKELITKRIDEFTKL